MNLLFRGVATMVAIGFVAQTPQAPATGIVAGRVLDATGAPVPAATVFLVKGPAPPYAIRGYPPGTGHVLADDSGRFVFSNVAPGTYRVEVDKPGWLKGAVGRRRPGGPGSTFDLADGERRNDFAITLWRAAAIGGRVVDDTGDPLIGAEVRAIKQVYIAGRRQGDTPIRAKTDDRGVYRFSGLMPGDYIVAVIATVLSEPAGFAGAIRAAQETPPSYLQTMTATGAMPMTFDRATGSVGADRPLVGSLTPLPGLPSASGAWPIYPTTYHPSSTSMSSATTIHVQTGEARDDVDITARLTSTWTVSGVLRDADGPAAWHAIHLVPVETGDRPIVDVATAITDPKGAFTFYGVPAGRYIARVIRVPKPSAGARFGLAGGTGEILRVMAFRDGPSNGGPTSTDSLWYANETVVVNDRAIRDLVVTMREGPRVRGRARFEGSRAQPTADEWRGADVSLMPANGREDVGIWPAPFAADGRFTSSSVWPGRYLVNATAPAGWHFKDATLQGRDGSTRPLDVASDLDNVIVTFADQVRTIKGNLQVEPGSSAEAATVLLFPADSASWVDFGRTNRMFASARVPASGQVQPHAAAGGRLLHDRGARRIRGAVAESRDVGETRAVG